MGQMLRLDKCYQSEFQWSSNLWSEFSEFGNKSRLDNLEKSQLKTL